MVYCCLYGIVMLFALAYVVFVMCLSYLCVVSAACMYVCLLADSWYAWTEMDHDKYEYKHVHCI